MSDHAHTIRFGVAQADHSTVPAVECVTHNDGCEFAAWVDADGHSNVLYGLFWPPGVADIVWSPLVVVEERYPESPDEPTWNFHVQPSVPGDV